MRIKIEFEVEIPDIEHTENELEEFLRFTYGAISSMRLENPFNYYDADAILDTFNWEIQ